MEELISASFGSMKEMQVQVILYVILSSITDPNNTQPLLYIYILYNCNQFARHAAALFGPGWVWLVDNDGQLQIKTTFGKYHLSITLLPFNSILFYSFP